MKNLYLICSTRARYYNSDLSVWLSVDPMAHASPHQSPYAYCSNNPVGRVDPTGMIDDLVITGGAADDAVAQLQQSTPNLTLTRDAATGKVEATGTAKTPIEKQVQAMANDTQITVNITAENSNTLSTGETTNGGSYMGNSVQKDANGNVTHVDTYQEVNPQALASWDQKTNSTGLMAHEAIESYIGGQIANKSGNASPKAGQPGSTYNQAHLAANKYSLGGIQSMQTPGFSIQINKGVDRLCNPIIIKNVTRTTYQKGNF